MEEQSHSIYEMIYSIKIKDLTPNVRVVHLIDIVERDTLRKILDAIFDKGVDVVTHLSVTGQGRYAIYLSGGHTFYSFNIKPNNILDDLIAEDIDRERPMKSAS